MADRDWHKARLIPTTGINGSREQERRATSALLAVMSSVREFGRELTQPLGAPSGRLETFIEVPFALGDRNVRPDGLIRVSRGSKCWTALVEVKTGTNELSHEQLESYLDVANAERFDAVISISNQIPPTPGGHPTTVDPKKLKKAPLCHWSWSQVLAAAVVQKEHHGVADPDQAWILGELIRYLEHSGSGALEFNDMGPKWISVRDAVQAGTLRATDRTVPQVVARFDALLQYVSLHLGRDLGTEVTVALSKKTLADPAAHLHSQVASLAQTGQLEGRIRIPNTVGPLLITADLRAAQVTCQVSIDAPRTGRPSTRVNWLLRQLRSAPDNVRLEATVAHQRGPGAAELLGKVRKQPQLLVADPKKDLRTFTIALTQPMGRKRKSGRGGFIDAVISAVDSFYRQVMQNLKPWSAPAPKLREPEDQDELDPLAATADLAVPSIQSPSDPANVVRNATTEQALQAGPRAEVDRVTPD
jgi:hypothetical protein